MTTTTHPAAIWHPPPLLRNQLDAEQRTVLDALYPDAVGRARAIPRADLADRYYRAGHAPSLSAADRRLRDTIATLVIAHRVPIVGQNTTPYGYYICETLDELAAADDYLTQYIRALSERATTYRRLRQQLGTTQTTLLDLTRTS